MNTIMVNRFCSNDDPYIIWPYYTGRDKGPLRVHLAGSEDNGASALLVLGNPPTK